MKSYLVNASNLHVGGGVQVASSLIDELSRIDGVPATLSVLASDEVHLSLMRMNTDCSRFFSYEIFNTYGIAALWSRLGEKMRNFDVVYTVFGPLYFFGGRSINIVGFAQPWMIYSSKNLYRTMSFSSGVRARAKLFFQSLFFRLADRLVVELEHVKYGLISRGLFDGERIDVVHNCVSSLYFHPELWVDLSFDISPKKFSIGFVGRDYAHKNTNCLPIIKNFLVDLYGVDVDFYVTFNASEWAAKSDNFRDSVINAGELEVAQCPCFYQKMDAVIFPSLLECFSATPLEAMAMMKPLFASDRGFVRDVCGDFPFYFDPDNPREAADQIFAYLKNFAGRDKVRLAAACEHALNFSSAKKRAEDCFEIMCLAARSRGV